jgi:hypothetical protein
MVLQFFTKHRPNLDVPFFEDSDEGKARADAIIQLANEHPELCLGRDAMPQPATELTWTATWTFAGFPEFNQFMALAQELDVSLRVDRARYYIRNKHTLIIEHQNEGDAERSLNVSIGPDNVRGPNGIINFI